MKILRIFHGKELIEWCVVRPETNRDRGPKGEGWKWRRAGGRMAGCMQGGKGREAGGRWLEDRRDGSTIRLTEGREGRRGQY